MTSYWESDRNENLREVAHCVCVCVWLEKQEVAACDIWRNIWREASRCLYVWGGVCVDVDVDVQYVCGSCGVRLKAKS